ncbi:MAG: hypothetical protein IJ048_13045 [Clostridia bacterium]|nr:hypothetical protein [Clostridia bacterium]
MARMNGVLFADLPAICPEKGGLSPLRRLGFWHTVPYLTKETAGVMLSAQNQSRPGPIELRPSLTGFCRVYVGVAAIVGCWQNNNVLLRLSGDAGYTLFSPASDIVGSGVEEVFWKCADMTDQSVFLKKPDGVPCDCILAWLRFEPMSEAEVEAFRVDAPRRCVYAANDMHNMAFLYAAKTPEDWLMAVMPYEQSDVEWLSVENVRVNDGALPVPAEEYAFARDGDANVHELFRTAYTDDMLRALVRQGHAMGIKMCVSQRMGAWCMTFPYESVNTFAAAHPELRCIDRDGTPVDALSYSYAAVQDYIIGMLVAHAANGFDAVELMFHRGVPYVLFEEPFVRRFEETYGVDPRVLPWDDGRIMEARCAVVTGFVARLRRALDGVGHARVGIHIRTGHTVYDSRMIGVDPFAMAKAGLITAVISYPAIWRELPEVDVWQEGEDHLIDPAKYGRVADEMDTSVIMRREGFDYVGAFPDSRGVMRGGGSEAERVAEWAKLEAEGVRVYFDIMPRVMSAMEYRRRLMEIFEAGGRGVSLWDTHQRAAMRRTWNLLRRAGHRDEIAAFSRGEDGCSTRHRFLELGGLSERRVRPSWGS